MNYFKRKKIIIWINVLMFITTLSIILGIACEKDNTRKCEGVYYIDWSFPSENVSSTEKEIGLTKKQKSEIEKVTFDLFKKNENLFIQKKENLIKIYNHIYNNSKDTAKLDSIYNDLNIVNRKLDKYIQDVLSEISKICTPEQRIKQKESANELINYMESQYIYNIKDEIEKQNIILKSHQ